MDKELNDYIEKRITDLEKDLTRIYTVIDFCIVGIILFVAGRYLGVL